MFARLAGVEVYYGRDITKRVHGNHGAYRFENGGGFEAWAFGRVLVVSSRPEDEPG